MRYEVIDNFLTPEECDRMIELAKPRMSKSKVWKIENGKEEDDDSHRRSEQCWLGLSESMFVGGLERRISEKAGIPASHGEGLQVAHYQVGGYFHGHFDYFEPNYEGNKAALADGGQRVKTFMVYLNDVEQGGETYFPALPQIFKPKKGMALMWDNVLPDGRVDPSSYHSAEVVMKGEKWIFTKWLREKPRQEAIQKGLAP